MIAFLKLFSFVPQLLGTFFETSSSARAQELELATQNQRKAKKRK